MAKNRRRQRHFPRRGNQQTPQSGQTPESGGVDRPEQRASDTMTIADPAHRDPHPVLSAGPTKPDRTVAQLVVISLVVVGAGLLGFTFKPEDSEIEPLKDSVFGIETPRFVTGPDKKPNPLQGIFWLEAHGTKIPGFDDIQWSSNKLSDPAPDSIRVAFLVGYERPWQSGTGWSGQFDLPDGAYVEKCIPLPGFNCATAPSNFPDGVGRTRNVVKIDGKVDVGPTGHYEGSGLLVVLDIRGATSGLTYSKSRTKAVVRRPTLTLTPLDQSKPPGTEQFDKPIGVINQVFFDRASKLKWSEDPQPIGLTNGIAMPIKVNGEDTSLGTDSSSWAYPMWDTAPITFPFITGTDEDAVDQDATDLFWAGVLFGVAGGGVITAAQLVVVGLQFPENWRSKLRDWKRRRRWRQRR